jgi:hypothetical protein
MRAVASAMKSGSAMVASKALRSASVLGVPGGHQRVAHFGG